MADNRKTPGKGGLDKSRGAMQFATFYLNNELFGIPILQVQEILLNQKVTPVPLAPDHVMGLIGLRGQIVTAVNLKKRVGLGEVTSVEEPYHLVVSHNGSVASLEVDSVGDVLELPSAKFEKPPESLEGIDAAFLEGVFMLEDRILGIIDVPAVLEAA
jgi:purine-binding chemotaxis protein CheW